MKKTALFSKTSPLSFFKKGFTLIELVVVISIIAILSTIALFGFSKAQASGRDASRSQTLNSFRSALERFYSDNGYYPKTVAVPPPADGGDFGKMATVLNAAGYLVTTSITDPSKNCTTMPAIPASGNWTPCGTPNIAPIYVYDSSTTAYVAANCGWKVVSGATVADVSGCKAACPASAGAGSCYSIFLFNEASQKVTEFESPQ